MKEKVRSIKPFRVVGLSTRSSRALESNPETAKIPGLWFRLLDTGAMFQIKSRVSRIEYLTLYTDFENKRDGPFSVIAGQRSLRVSEPPDELQAFTFSGGEYLVFTANGKSPEAVDKGWKRIEEFFAASTEYRRAFTTDFEVTGLVPNHAKIFVSTKRRSEI